VTADGGPPAADVTYGIDIGGTKVLGVALSRSDEIVADAREATPKGTRNSVGSHVAEVVARVVADLDEQLGATVPVATPVTAPVAVGVGAPGMVDRRGRLCFAPNLPQAQGVDWNELIGDRLPGRTVLIENDANLAVLAEHRIGAAVGHDHVVMVTLGTGIGGGLVVDGRVQVGAAGFAGEVGHMVVDPAGPPCPCGRRGCWERFASGAGLGMLAREAALAGFAQGRIRLLVATTVIEVGVDVPAASVMVVEHAERFGLAQLHQLRGRVGRGETPSFCLLLHDDGLNESARKRLLMLRDTEDGFVIADADFRIRGGGDVLGTRQAGLPGFRLADPIAHEGLLHMASRDAALLLERDPTLAGERGRAIRVLLRLFEQRDAMRTLLAG